jgi:hypothetical protein
MRFKIPAGIYLIPADHYYEGYAAKITTSIEFQLVLF